MFSPYVLHIHMFIHIIFFIRLVHSRIMHMASIIFYV